jgi:hypothetical protein
MKPLRILLAIGLLAMSACASKPIAENEVFIGQVSYMATADEATNGFHYVAQPDEALQHVLPRSGDVPPAKSLIAACGQNPDAKFVLVRLYYYWLNSGVAVASFTPWTMVSAELPVARGNIVEVDMRSGRSSSRCAVITKVRAASLSEGSCEYRLDKEGALISALSVFSPNGGPGSASLYCPSLETEGWKTVHLGPGNGGLVWSKSPAATRE